MAANFYLSTHANYHLYSKTNLDEAMKLDLNYATIQEINWIKIWSGSILQSLSKIFNLRQQIISTSIIYFNRFYLRNSFCNLNLDSRLIAITCLYLASKSEESPLHIKSILTQAKLLFKDLDYLDQTILAEMEFYLLEELDFHLIVFHPYHSLLQLSSRQSQSTLSLDDTTLQMAWFVINDTYRTNLCLLHPPHLIAIAAIYLALSLHPPPAVNSTTSTTTTATTTTTAVPDHITFLAALNVDMTIILEIVQEIISLYELWNALEEKAAAVGSLPNQSNTSSAGKGKSIGGPTSTTVGADEFVLGILQRMRKEHEAVVAKSAIGVGSSNVAIKSGKGVKR